MREAPSPCSALYAGREACVPYSRHQLQHPSARSITCWGCEGKEVAEFGVGHARQLFFAGAYREVGKFLLLLYHVVDAFLECVARYEAVHLF